MSLRELLEEYLGLQRPAPPGTTRLVDRLVPDDAVQRAPDYEAWSTSNRKWCEFFHRGRV